MRRSAVLVPVRVRARSRAAKQTKSRARGISPCAPECRNVTALSIRRSTEAVHGKLLEAEEDAPCARRKSPAAHALSLGGGGGSARIEAIRPFPRQERNRARPPVTPSTRRFPVAAISHRYRLRTQPVSMRTAATTLCMWKNNDKKKDGRSRTVVPRAVNLRIKGSVWRPIQPFSATSLYLVESGELLNKKATPSE